MISTFKKEPHGNTPGTTIHNLQVRRDIHKIWNSTLDYNIQFKACPKCNYRWIFTGFKTRACQPRNPGQLDFNGDDTWCLQQ